MSLELYTSTNESATAGIPSPMLTQVSPGVDRTENTASTSTTIPKVSKASRPPREPSVSG
ncbi:hypothetical protein ACFVWG_07475 [Kribbella sp. NPDC058245]|uniref:hypothetical protein n=1 Tax=Kribbella sp. NPDC058245 TaxID=3346399 RepID=UPI0036E0659B